MLSNLNPEPLHIDEPPVYLANIPLLRQITRLRVAQAFNVFLHSLDISSRYLTIMRLKADQPDVMIQPDLKDIGMLDRVEDPNLVRGEEATKAILPELKRKTSWSSKFRRSLGFKQPAIIETA